MERRTWIIGAVGIASLLAACQSAPITGRQQLMLVSPDQERELGEEAYRKTLKASKISDDQAATEMVRRVGERIAAAAERPDYQWEFRLIEDESPNAFALPGGKVAIYTGILPYTKTEAGLAVVMGHEVAHALARHGAERMSTGLLAQLGASSAAAIFGGSDPRTAQAVEAAFGIGTQVGIVLPFGRKQELEADRIGLTMMAKAGYDPREAVEFWKRMEAAKGGAKPPEFLSTHPGDEKRIEQIEGWLPEAERVYHASAR